MSNLPNFPTIRPSLLLDFANSKQVDPRISFTRASTATYFDAQGVLRTAASGVPRIDHDPVTGECKGLLIEEARTNLLTYSEQFDNAAWTKTGATITANAIAAPNGAPEADKLVEDTSTSHHRVNLVGTGLANNVSRCLSVFAKAAERNVIHLVINAFSGNYVLGTFNLVTGEVSSSAFGNGVVASANAYNVGGGYWRVCLAGTPNTASATTSVDYYIALGNGAYGGYTGNGTSGIYIWGAQLEVGSTPTSYIPTAAAAATRAADAVSMSGTNFSEWYRQDEGMFVVEYILSNITTNCGVMAVSDGTDANRMIVRGASTGVTTFIGVSGGATQYNDGFASGLANVRTLVAFGYKTNAFVGTRNGAAPITDVSCVVPTVSMLRLGADGGGAHPLNGHIRRIAYYPVKISSSQLQALTS